MSFGFSVGDIILLSQLSYKLYTTVTSGRSRADRDLIELEDVLFGLRCALDHLSGVAGTIIQSTTTAPAEENAENNGPDILRKLGTLIRSCRTTLQDLDDATKRYRDDIEIASVDEASFRQRLKGNFSRIKWDMDRKSLKEYRDKLQSHTDAINIVLSALIWSTTNRMEIQSKHQSERTEQLLGQTLRSNSDLQQLVKEIHDRLTLLLSQKNRALPTQEAESPPFKEAPEVPPPLSPRSLPALPSRGGQGGLWADAAAPGRKLQDQPQETFLANAYYATMGPMQERTMPIHPLHGRKRHFQPMGASAEMSGLKAGNNQPPGTDTAANDNNQIAAPFTTHHPIAKTNKPLANVNVKRQTIGSSEFLQYKNRHQRPSHLVKPSFLNREIPEIQDLEDGLTFIFRPTQFSAAATARQMQTQEMNRADDFVRWMKSFVEILDTSTLMSSAVGNSTDREERNNKVNGILVLLGHLNEVLAESHNSSTSETTMAAARDVFYRAADQTCLEDALVRFQASSKLVRVQRELEEYVDGRTEWMKRKERDMDGMYD